MARLLRWLTNGRGDMVWSALVIVTVMIPLMGLTLDIPRYFILRSTLQNAADAAAEAAAQTADGAAFIHAGDQELLAGSALQYAQRVFTEAAAPLSAKGSHLALDGFSIDESGNRVIVTAHGDIRYLFGLAPRVTLHVRGASRFRSIRE
jgi:uncharacterized membrane protein